MVVTSPPYDCLRTYDGYVGAFDFEATAEQLWRIIKPGGVVVWIVNDATIKGDKTCTSFRQVLHFKELGFALYDTLIYEKAGVQFQPRGRYQSAFEYMFVLAKGRPAAVNLLKDRANKNAGKKITGTERKADGTLRQKPAVRDGTNRVVPETGLRTTIWRYASGNCCGTKSRATYRHPATFPLKLAVDHIKSWSNAGDLVLDCFMGSGTTAVAALMTGRRYLGYEINPEYCAVARERIEAWRGELFAEVEL